MPYYFIRAIATFAAVRKTTNEIFIKEFGKNLRRIRLSKDISMQTLAYTINVEYSQISRIELGKINTSIGTVYEIANALEVSLKELFDFEVENN